jgi:hypothetical protein
MLADVRVFRIAAFHALNYCHIKFIVPVSCGRLPTDIGMPSGGSLTADQWLLLATAYGPIIVSLCIFFYLCNSAVA